jgi:hypothetical protein
MLAQLSRLEAIIRSLTADCYRRVQTLSILDANQEQLLDMIKKYEDEMGKIDYLELKYTSDSKERKVKRTLEG